MNLATDFAYAYLARSNPALPPRRRLQTARKHAMCVRRICIWAHGTGWAPDDLEVARWAAEFHLSAGSAMPLPPDYGVVSPGEGSLRQHACDAGGVEGTVLRALAKFVLDGHADPTIPQSHVDPTDWTAWSLLYPATALLAGRGCNVHHRPQRDPAPGTADEGRLLDEAIREWEVWTTLPAGSHTLPEYPGTYYATSRREDEPDSVFAATHEAARIRAAEIVETEGGVVGLWHVSPRSDHHELTLLEWLDPVPRSVPSL